SATPPIDLRIVASEPHADLVHAERRARFPDALPVERLDLRLACHEIAERERRAVRESEDAQRDLEQAIAAVRMQADVRVAIAAVRRLARGVADLQHEVR